MSLVFLILLSCCLYGANSIKCFECSSLEIPGCGDPFYANSTLKECPVLYGNEPKMCRKLRQTVDTPLGKIVRITRSCGYVEDKNSERDNDCFRASFTAGSSSRYCACQEDGCNSANSIQMTSLVVVTLLAFFFYSIVY